MQQLPTSPPLRVLLVDDLPDLIQSMSALLRLWGHDVRTAGDGPEALDVAADYHPHVILLDVSLPGMDGYQVARRLRNSPDSRRTFLVSVTGHDGEADRERSREASCDRHLIKPVNPDDLQRLLASRKEARDEDRSHDISEADLPRADSCTAIVSDVSKAAEDRLRRHPYLTLRRISCEYRQGILTLKGFLPTYYLKQIAQATVAGIEGIERIENEIEVANSTSTHRY